MKKENAIEKLKESQRVIEWIRGELETCAIRIKILQEDAIRGEENHEEVETEDQVMTELHARALFESRHVKILQKIVNV